MGFDFNVKYHETPKSSIVLTKPMLICWRKKKWKLFVVWQTWALPNRYCGCYSSANSKHELLLCAIHRFHQMSKSSWFYILTHNRVMHKPCKNMSDTHSKKNNLHCLTRWFKCAIIKCFRLLFDANFVPVPTE